MSKFKRVISVIAASAVASTTLVAASPAANAAITLTISTDLPLQGSAFDSNDSTNKAIELYLKQVGNKAGKYSIKFKKYDNATAAKGSWDDAKCAANAQAHVANKSEVAVMGTYNSGCSKIIVPILNQDPNGPMTMISHANTNPGLTKTWNPGEPDAYYPKSVRNYGRICSTDDIQGAAAAQFAKEIGIKSVYVLNDTTTYGQGVARAFTTEAEKQGLTVLSSGTYGDSWDALATSYESLFTKIKALKPDMVYLGGIFDNNGGLLVKEKVKVLGDNKVVKLMGPDGFTGYPDLNKLKEADGMYLSFTGLPLDLLLANSPTGAGAKFVGSYKKAYGIDPVGSYPLYGVAAVQVILAAIAKSNGTRKGITNAIFSGTGIKIPAKISVLGKEIGISTLSGDTLAKDFTIEVIKGGEETTLMAWNVK